LVAIPYCYVKPFTGIACHVQQLWALIDGWWLKQFLQLFGRSDSTSCNQRSNDCDNETIVNLQVAGEKSH
jgi:hypothetical protein